MTSFVCIIPSIAVADETGVVLAADVTVNPIVSIETAKPDPLTQGTNVKYQLFNTGTAQPGGIYQVVNGRLIRPFIQQDGTNTVYSTSTAIPIMTNNQAFAVNDAAKNNSDQAPLSTAPWFLLTGICFAKVAKKRPFKQLGIAHFFRIRKNFAAAT